MISMSVQLEPWIRAKAQATANELLASIEGANAVVVATEDGFDVASAIAKPVDPPRIAAMTSSISAIGQILSQEASLGRPDCLVVDASDGYLIMRRAVCGSVVLVINALTSRKALLGLAMHSVAAAAKQLEAAS
jgi:predicted regulator of Ras-like GTPase activity (Roadblock/LC7/MglB family)